MVGAMLQQLWIYWGGRLMDNPTLVLAISKLAAAGEQAGLTLEEMIDLLDHGLEVESLLELNCRRLHGVAMPIAHEVSRYRWVM
jgi:hypothetical protein